MFVLPLLIGVAVGVGIIAYWNSIRDWLNNVAADAMERAFGYNARRNMIKAISIADRFISKVRNVSTVFSKRTETTFNKVMLKTEEDETEFNAEVIDKLRNGQIVQELSYTE